MNEIWKDIPGYEGKYQVSNLGRIKTLPHKHIYSDGQVHYCKERIRKPGVGPTGYLSIKLGSKGREAGVHRFVAEAFLPRVEGKNDVNHIDGNKSNNRIDNLEWVTRAENMAHCKHILGKQAGNAEIKVLCVETGEVFESMTKASEIKQVNIGHLSEVINKMGRKSCGGYHWERLDSI